MAQTVKNLPVMQETRAQSLGQKDPLEKGMAIHSSILAWKSHGQKDLMSYSTWSRKELGTTEHTHTTHTYLLSFPGQSHEVAIMTFYS